MTFGKVLEAFKSRYQDSGSEGKELYLIDKKSGKKYFSRFTTRSKVQSFNIVTILALCNSPECLFDYPINFRCRSKKKVLQRFDVL